MAALSMSFPLSEGSGAARASRRSTALAAFLSPARLSANVLRFGCVKVVQYDGPEGSFQSLPSLTTGTLGLCLADHQTLYLG